MVQFVGADDAHGAPIMIAAEKAGKTPQQFVAEIAAGRKEYLDGFHIRFDNWHSTDSPENTELAQQIYRDLKANGLITSKTIEQFFDPEGHVPARPLHQGRVPELPRQGPVRRQLRGLQQGLQPTDLINPYSTLSGAKPVLRSSEHFFFQLSDPRWWTSSRVDARTASCSPRC
jgi:methionyl-tRNA synthetase